MAKPSGAVPVLTPGRTDSPLTAAGRDNSDFALGTATVSSLGYERDGRVVTRWNLLLSA
jgi:hypothetical protein